MRLTVYAFQYTHMIMPITVYTYVYTYKCIPKGEVDMRTIAIVSQKGGVGKTTTAHALGAGLLLKGKKVLFVDLDGQGNLSFTLRSSRQNSVMSALQRQRPIAEVIENTGMGTIIPSTAALIGADAVINMTGKEYRLREALKPIENDYDYAILDTSPTLGILTVNALTACQDAIIAAQADIYSVQGIDQLKETLDAVREYCNPDISIRGILLTLFFPRTVVAREATDFMEQQAHIINTSVFQTRIRESTAIKEAQIMRQDIFTYAPKSNGSIDYMAFIEEYLAGIEQGGDKHAS